MPLHQIVYVSSARYSNMSDLDLRDIFEKAMLNNSKNGITGALIYFEDTFMQLLEGEREAVIERFSIIRNDKRHKGVIVLMGDDVEKRSFPGFSMNCRKLSESDCITNPECKKILAEGFVSPKIVKDSSAAVRLLSSFCEQNDNRLRFR